MEREGMDGEGERTWRARQSENREDCLYDAAFRGDLVSLQAIIAKDKCILDKVLVGGFKGKNPLHVAIATGQEDIVRELMRIKPELAEVLDAQLGVALHVACSKGNLEIVKLLVGVSPGMCLARDREGNNPLHVAAMKGNVDVLKTLLQTRPNAARVTTDRGDTILHLCVNYNQPGSLQLLTQMVRGQEFLDSTDGSGNNALHLAVFCNQYEIIKHLLSNLEVDVNARNGSGWTALEIHSHVATSLDPNSVDHDRIEDLLSKAGAKRCSELLIPFDPSWQKKKKSTLMIVSSLMATMTFKVGVNPPGGVWSDSSKDHIAGTAIIASTLVSDSYPILMCFNTVAFLLCLTTIYDLIVVLPADKQDSGFAQSGFLRFWFSWLTIMTVVFVYPFSVVVIAPLDNAGNPSFFTEAIILIAMVWCILVSFMGRAPLKVRLAIGVVTVVIATLVEYLTRYFEGAWSAMLFFAVTLAVAGVLLLMIHKRGIVEITLQRWLRRPQTQPQHQSEMQLARTTSV